MLILHHFATIWCFELAIWFFFVTSWIHSVSIWCRPTIANRIIWAIWWTPLCVMSLLTNLYNLMRMCINHLVIFDTIWYYLGPLYHTSYPLLSDSDYTLALHTLWYYSYLKFIPQNYYYMISPMFFGTYEVPSDVSAWLVSPNTMTFFYISNVNMLLLMIHIIHLVIIHLTMIQHMIRHTLWHMIRPMIRH